MPGTMPGPLSGSSWASMTPLEFVLFFSSVVESLASTTDSGTSGMQRNYRSSKGLMLDIVGMLGMRVQHDRECIERTEVGTTR